MGFDREGVVKELMASRSIKPVQDGDTKMRRGQLLKSDDFSLSTPNVPARSQRRRVLGPSKMVKRDDNDTTHDTMRDVAEKKKAGHPDIKYAKGFYEIMPLGPTSKRRATVHVSPLQNGRKFQMEDKSGKVHVSSRKNFEWMMPQWTTRGFRREGTMDRQFVVAELSQIRRLVARQRQAILSPGMSKVVKDECL